MRELLRALARDSFAAIEDETLARELSGLGVALRQAASQLERSGDAWGPWLSRVESFIDAPVQQRRRTVAEGLRLLATLAPVSKPRPASARRGAARQLSPSSTVTTPITVTTALAGAVPSELVGLPGIGPKTAERLAERGITTYEDAAYLLPLGYTDLRRRQPLTEIADGEPAVVEGTVERFREAYVRGKVIATLQLRSDDGHSVEARWFHRVGGLAQKATSGARLVLVGTLKRFRGVYAFVHPLVHASAEAVEPIAVRYPVIEGVGQSVLGRLCRGALAHLQTRPESIDALPDGIAREHGIPTQLQALEMLHVPDATASVEHVLELDQHRSLAHRRLAFDEFFFLQLAVLRERAAWRGQPVAVVPPEGGVERERVRACVPFEPTAAQWRTLREIECDMASGRPMLRLLQGDVGSGKTFVAFAAALGMTDAGAQVAWMAPTEILADQHYKTLSRWAESAGLRVARLTAALGKAQRKSLLSLLQAGHIDIVVGTHALLVDDVQFKCLGYVVVDEQHRFGVEQRARLRAKGTAPHLLVMTATPIPRTLALTAYGELDASVLDEMPPGRIPPDTRLYSGASGLVKARQLVAEAVARDAKGFVVCPLVEESETIDATDVQATASALRGLLPHTPIAVVHGRMASRDKDEVMRSFVQGDVRVLVATTVIEVGVDVPDARVMLVEHAERFGLAQLHQLRGRVGRGGQSSLCLLHSMSGPQSEAGRRLAAMRETHDGFRLAEHDLAQRGPGEIFGTQQSGAPRLRFAGFAGEGIQLLLAARDAAAKLLAEDAALTRHPRVRLELERRMQTRVFTAAAG